MVVLLCIILSTKKLCVKFVVLKVQNIVITENYVLMGVAPCGVEIIVGVSEDSQYISTECNGVTSRKNALFIVHPENLKSHLAITECDIMLEQPISSLPSTQ